MPSQIGLVAALSLGLLASPAGAAPRPHSRLLQPVPAAMRTIAVFGQRTAYYEAGRGSTLILIPHLGWDSNMWGQNFAALARTRHVIAIDPLGQGASAKPMISYKMNTWTDQFAEFMRLKGIGRAAFAGTGMGGALAVQMALDHPERVSAIVVAASNSGPGPHLGGPQRDAALSSLAGSREILLANIFDPSLVTEEVVRARLEYRMRVNDGYVIEKHMSDHRPPYSPDELARIKVPALFVWCRQDRETPPDWGADFAKAVAGAELALLDRCGHFPNLEQPQAFDQAVDTFLRGHDPDEPGGGRRRPTAVGPANEARRAGAGA
jgi:pimeloyl-ACP methyl ester carboxylesterase